jgi:DNA-binding transcriptional LysR family regulator
VELRHLRYFIAVAEELNFTRASRRLSIAQPPLSQQIRRLEQELGVALFTRTKRRVVLTNAGRSFLERSYQIIGSVEQAVSLTQRVHRGQEGRLVVGFLEYMSSTLIPPVMRAFRDKHPDVEIVLRPLANNHQLPALRSGDIDVSLLRPPVDDNEILSDLILREPFVLALPANHRLAKRRAVRISEVAGDPFVMYRKEVGPAFFTQIYDFCARNGVTPKAALDVTQIQTAVGLVSAGIGVALVPRSVTRVIVENVVYKPFVEASPTVDVAFAWQVHSALVAQFLRTCKSTAATFS